MALVPDVPDDATVVVMFAVPDAVVDADESAATPPAPVAPPTL